MDSQDAVITEVSTTSSGDTSLKLDPAPAAVLSETDTPGMGVEVALLSRNIKIEGDSSDVFNGGYLQVFHTPDVPQVIEGVEFTNMGQKGGKNRFALQFLYTRDVNGTSISRNSIRNSFHRCISMDGVSSATIAANVAHNTAGHCYYIGYEASDNVILNNIGSKTNDMIRWTEQLAGFNDHDRATFYFRHPTNDYIGNVAAGSAGRG